MPVKSPNDLSREVLRGVNELRAMAKLAPLEGADAESTTADKLVGHFYEAESKQDRAKTDLVVLSLLAGYDVKGMIRHGGFFAAERAGTNDASRWLERAFEMPMARHTLLDPGARKLAIGASASDGMLVSILTTYAMFETEDHKPDILKLQDLVTAERAKRGLAPQRRVAARRCEQERRRGRARR